MVYNIEAALLECRIPVAIFSKMSLMKEFRMLIALELIPVSGCTCEGIDKQLQPQPGLNAMATSSARLGLLAAVGKLPC